jgi:hypothetical protein
MVAAPLMLPRSAAAHGLGGRSDLPVPLEYFLVGALAVLLVSFGALAVLWPAPRLQDGPRWRGTGWRPGRLVGGVGAAIGVAGLAVVIVAGLAGDPDARSNAAPVMVWVVTWLALPFLGVMVGNLWAVINPWAAMGRLLGWSGPSGQGRYGVLPAAIGLVAFTWLELVYPDSGDPRTLGIAAVVYTSYLLVLAKRFGTERAVTSADLFTVYHRVLSAIAPIGRDRAGRIRRRGWLRALAVLPAWRGLTVFVVAMIGTVTYDGLSSTPWWEDVTIAIGVSRDAMWFETLALVATVALLGLLYHAACASAARIAGGGIGTAAVARSFAHTLVPIALAYAFAHYFTLVVFEGQIVVAAISDPFGLGWNLFGTVDYRPNFTWLSPTAVWWVQLVAILGGHVSGVVLAHDRSLAVFPAERAVRSQYAMLGLMVALTTLGLTILAAG